MVHARWQQILEEYDASQDATGDRELAAVKAAIFLEDALGLTLTDDDITPERLCDVAGVRAVLARAQDTL